MLRTASGQSHRRGGLRPRVFALAGLTLPDAGLRREDFSYEQRLSVALLYLVSQFARRLLNGIERAGLPKAIFLDQGDAAITSTPEGAKLVPEVIPGWAAFADTRLRSPGVAGRAAK